MTERLDRIEALVEKNVQAIQSNSKAIGTATDERQELKEVFLATLQIVSDSSQAQTEILKNIRQMQQQVSEMQSEVRDLQVENRRIIDRTFVVNHNSPQKPTQFCHRTAWFQFWDRWKILLLRRTVVGGLSYISFGLQPLIKRFPWIEPYKKLGQIRIYIFLNFGNFDSHAFR